jgi:hypothetical protein
MLSKANRKKVALTNLLNLVHSQPLKVNHPKAVCPHRKAHRKAHRNHRWRKDHPCLKHPFVRHMAVASTS